MTTIEELQQRAVQLASDISRIDDQVITLRNALNKMVDEQENKQHPLEKGKWVQVRTLYGRRLESFSGSIRVEENDLHIKIPFSTKDDAISLARRIQMRVLPIRVSSEMD